MFKWSKVQSGNIAAFWGPKNFPIPWRPPHRASPHPFLQNKIATPSLHVNYISKFFKKSIFFKSKAATVYDSANLLQVHRVTQASDLLPIDCKDLLYNPLKCFLKKWQRENEEERLSPNCKENVQTDHLENDLCLCMDSWESIKTFLLTFWLPYPQTSLLPVHQAQ